MVRIFSPKFEYLEYVLNYNIKYNIKILPWPRKKLLNTGPNEFSFFKNTHTFLFGNNLKLTDNLPKYK